jgi:alkaline phosphatase
LLQAASDAPPFTLIGAGDPHCDKSTFTRARITSDMIKQVLDADPAAKAFLAGDVTHRGSAAEHATYYLPTYGGVRDRTICTQGDHDRWNSDGAPAQHYYAYTGAPKYGAWNLGDYYRIYSLNCESLSNGGVDHAKQLAWLKADLAEHSATRHIIAITHKPLFANVCELHKVTMTFAWRVKPMWEVLQQHGCEAVFAGHAHRLEVWKRKMADGTLSGKGIRQFIVGTGGVTLRGIVGARHAHCESVVKAHGVLRLDLHADHYEWMFVDSTRVVRAKGSQICRKVLA